MSDFFEAIQAGDVARVTSLLDDDASLLQTRENGVTPVMLAIYHGKRELAQLFVDRGASISFPEACALGDRERVERMLSEDRTLLGQRSADGYPPVGLAIFFGHGALARWLIDEGADVNAIAENAQRVAPLHAAAAACDRETIAMLLERGADVHAKQQQDFTPLHGVASRGDVEIAKLLLAHGADRNAKSADGMTAADVAHKYGHQAFADWITRG